MCFNVGFLSGIIYCCSTGFYVFTSGTAVRPCLKVDPEGAQWGEASFSKCMSNEVQEIHNEVRRKAFNNNDEDTRIIKCSPRITLQYKMLL